jgi:hypothetical protein
MKTFTHMTTPARPQVVAKVKLTPWPFTEDSVHLSSPTICVDARGVVEAGDFDLSTGNCLVTPAWPWIVELSNGNFVNGPQEWDGTIFWGEGW